MLVCVQWRILGSPEFLSNNKLIKLLNLIKIFTVDYYKYFVKNYSSVFAKMFCIYTFYYLY